MCKIISGPVIQTKQWTLALCTTSVLATSLIPAHPYGHLVESQAQESEQLGQEIIKENEGKGLTRDCKFI